MSKGLRTLCFIGSDKNAGKTTVLNFVYQKLKHKSSSQFVLSSVGINGEHVDNFQGHQKPRIAIKKHDFFITASEHLHSHDGFYEIIHIFSPPTFRKYFILAKALLDFNIILEGPNEKQGLLDIKVFLKNNFNDSIFILDGSIDRQFIAHPDISDEFYFALLASEDRGQLNKMHQLVAPLSMKTTSSTQASFIKKEVNEKTKSLLFSNDIILYKGDEIPFLDSKLIDALSKLQNESCYLYLNGALVPSLAEVLYVIPNITIILDNFTLAMTYNSDSPEFHPLQITLLHPVNTKAVFIRNTGFSGTITLPQGIPVHNIFRESDHEMGI